MTPLLLNFITFILFSFSSTVNGIIDDLHDVDLGAENRSCTGVLQSHPASCDVKITDVTLTFHGVELFVDSTVELNAGRRYGLLGLNGSGEFHGCRLYVMLNPI